jgi:SAM-dependent methyltransferase
MTGRAPLTEVSAVEPEAAARVAATIAPLLPPALVPVFDARFARSGALYEEFVYRLTTQIIAGTGLAKALAEWGSTEAIVRRAGMDPARAVVPVGWMLRHLSRRHVLEREDGADGPRFCAPHAVSALDAAAIAAAQREHDPACLPSYVLAETVAREYPGFLEGGTAGEQILFAPTRLPLWTSYFSNDHVLYAVNNHVGAVAVETWMPRAAGDILELGRGLASGATALLDRLARAGRRADVRTYRFTELVPAFLRRGQRTLTERFPDGPPLTFASLDMNRPFADQGIAPSSVSIVYAVNTLHVAHDLMLTLAEIREALEPGGQLIVSECVRPRAEDTLYPEFVFNLLETFRAPRLDPVYRPNGGFLTPEQWTAALDAAGFRDVRVLPDIARIREHFPGFYVAAIGATRPG